MTKRWSLVARGTLLGLAVCSLALLVWALAQHWRANSSDAPPDPNPPAPPSWGRLIGLTHHIYRQGALFSTITADAVTIRPRRYWVFTVKPFTEVEVTNARLVVHLQGSSAQDMGELPLFGEDGLLGLPAQGKGSARELFGKVTRARIEGLAIEVHQGPTVVFRLKASRGLVDFTEKVLRLKEVVLESPPTGRTIRAQTAVWNHQAQAVQIAGEYQAESPKGQATGRGIQVDLDFRLRPISNVPPHP